MIPFWSTLLLLFSHTPYSISILKLLRTGPQLQRCGTVTLDGVQPIQQPCAGVILQRAQTVQPQPLQRLGSVTHTTTLQRTPAPVPVPTPAGIGHSLGHGNIVGPKVIRPTAVFVKPAQAGRAFFGYQNWKCRGWPKPHTCAAHLKLSWPNFESTRAMKWRCRQNRGPWARTAASVHAALKTIAWSCPRLIKIAHYKFIFICRFPFLSLSQFTLITGLLLYEQTCFERSTCQRLGGFCSSLFSLSRRQVRCFIGIGSCGICKLPAACILGRSIRCIICPWTWPFHISFLIFDIMSRYPFDMFDNFWYSKSYLAYIGSSLFGGGDKASKAASAGNWWPNGLWQEHHLSNATVFIRRTVGAKTSIHCWCKPSKLWILSYSQTQRWANKSHPVEFLFLIQPWRNLDQPGWI